jgi:ABC-type nitrate/sulfonate/bicarbonate transport system permease component
MALAPLLLLYPLFLLIFGLSSTTIVMTALIAGLAPAILQAREAFSNTEGASRPLAVLQKVFLTAVMLAFANVVAIQMVTHIGGIGALVTTLSNDLEVSSTWAAILLVSLLIIGISVFARRGGAAHGF